MNAQITRLSSIGSLGSLLLLAALVSACAADGGSSSAASTAKTATGTDTTVLGGSSTGGGTGGTGGGTSTTTAVKMDGGWMQSCQAVVGNADVKSTSGTMNITGATYKAMTLASGTDGCTAQYTKVELEGTVAYGSAAAAPVGSTNIDITLTKVLVTPLNSTQAAGMSFLGLCGFRDWSSNVAKNVTGNACLTSLGVPTGKIYEIYQVMGSVTASQKLYLGQPGAAGSATDTTMATRRPASLTTQYYSRVSGG